MAITPRKARPGKLNQTRPTALKRSRLVHWRIPLRGGLDFRLVERPGLALSDPEMDRLVDDLRSVADRCVPRHEVRYGVLSGERERLEQTLIALIQDRETGRVMGFNAMAMLEIDSGGRSMNVLHAGLLMVDPNCRSRGHSLLLTAAPPILAFIRNRLRPLWVTNVTQVPAVAGIFSGGVETAYPSPGQDLPPSLDYAVVASRLMADHRAVFGVGEDASFDPETFVIQNSYTGGSDGLKKTFEQCRKHRADRFNDFCAERLDYVRGDDFLQVGRITPRFCARLAGRVMSGVRFPNPFRERRGRTHPIARTGRARRIVRRDVRSTLARAEKGAF